MATATISSEVRISTVRDEYDALAWPRVPADTRSRHAKHLRVLLDFARSFESFDGGRYRKNDWAAANVDIYSVSLRHEAIIYQWRKSWGSKYGTQVRKQYFVARWDKSADQHVIEEEIPAARARAAVRLFPDDPAGAVEYVLGLRKKPPARKQPALTGFKLVRVRTGHDGVEHFYSYFDGETEYRIGETATQTARGGHESGYYMYLSPELCEPGRIKTIAATQDDLAILRVEGFGKRVRYDQSGKYAVSHLTPIRIESYLLADGRRVSAVREKITR